MKFRSLGRSPRCGLDCETVTFAAESQGWSPVFKTSAFDRSATPPGHAEGSENPVDMGDLPCLWVVSPVPERAREAFPGGQSGSVKSREHEASLPRLSPGESRSGESADLTNTRYGAARMASEKGQGQ